MKRALIVFAKPPVPGSVKTRLIPPLTAESAAALYDAFVRDSLDAYTRLSCPLRLYVDGDPGAAPRAWNIEDLQVFEQKGEGLGARMLTAFSETFAAGAERVIIVGTDHPTLPMDFLELGFELLEEPLGLCIGPCRDGGYYCLGMNECYPSLFEGMTYSHGDVFKQTLERAGRISTSVSVLPEWYDVDTPESLDRLKEDLNSTGADLKHTRRVLESV